MIVAPHLSRTLHLAPRIEIRRILPALWSDMASAPECQAMYPEPPSRSAVMSRPGHSIETLDEDVLVVDHAILVCVYHSIGEGPPDRAIEGDRAVVTDHRVQLDLAVPIAAE